MVFLGSIILVVIFLFIVWLLFIPAFEAIGKKIEKVFVKVTNSKVTNSEEGMDE